MKKALTSIILTLAFPAFAGTVGLHVASYHDSGNFNNVNPGVYYRADSGLTIGTYCNSESAKNHCTLSSYAGYSLSSRSYNGFSTSLTLGVITGYQAGTMPMAVPSVAYKNVRLAFVPKVNKLGANVLHLMLEKDF